MSCPWYWALKYAGAFVRVQTMRVTWLGRENFPASGPFVLACSHVSHFDPPFLTIVLPRKVDWMARVSFWDRWLGRFILPRVDSFPVKRFDGVPVKAMRTSMKRLAMGRIVGIFPEGGVMRGRESVFFGGSIRGGAALLSRLGNAPIIPLTILGSPSFTRISPWLPFRRGRLWIRIGEPIYPIPVTSPRRAGREELNEILRQALIYNYRELRAKCPEIPDSAQGGPSPDISDLSDAPMAEIKVPKRVQVAAGRA